MRIAAKWFIADILKSETVAKLNSALPAAVFLLLCSICSCRTDKSPVGYTISAFS
jgi:hypothetical protein